LNREGAKDAKGFIFSWRSLRLGGSAIPHSAEVFGQEETLFQVGQPQGRPMADNRSSLRWRKGQEFLIHLGCFAPTHFSISHEPPCPRLSLPGPALLIVSSNNPTNPLANNLYYALQLAFRQDRIFVRSFEGNKGAEARIHGIGELPGFCANRIGTLMRADLPCFEPRRRKGR
jgi:hypothetical protein